MTDGGQFGGNDGRDGNRAVPATPGEQPAAPPQTPPSPAPMPASSFPSPEAATMKLPTLPHLAGTPPGVGAARQIGKYVVKRELGRGGMGAVYLAEQTGLGREVAIKELVP